MNYISKILKKKLILSLFFIFIYAENFANAGEQKIISLKADEISYLDNQNTVVAFGDAEVLWKDVLIKADKIIYNNSLKTIQAYGKIKIIEKDGSVVNAKYLEVEKDFSSGYLDEFNFIDKNDSKVIARKAKIKERNIYQLQEANMTSCPICEGKSPVWQVRAKDVEINNISHEVKYKYAFFEIYGYKIFYLPYFIHSTSDVKRKNGLLMPTLGNSFYLGKTITLPYYHSIASNKELIIAPVITTKAGQYLSYEYNHLSRHGLYGIQGSFGNHNINNRSNRYRYYANSTSNLKINEYWRFKHDIHLVSDKAYPREYGISDSDFFNSFLFLKYQNQADTKFGFKILDFKRLRAEYKNELPAPTISPEISYDFKKDLGFAKFSSESSMLFLDRKDNMNYRRISFINSLIFPNIVNLNGHKIDFITKLNSEFYNFNGYSNNNKNTVRIIPMVAFDWQYPIIKRTRANSILIEPMVRLIYSAGANNHEIQNEDSEYVELCADNLHNFNHYPGHDMQEYGLRANYGIKTNIYNQSNIKFSNMVGQTYHFKKNNFFTKNSGMDDKLSDIVGKISSDIDSNIILSYGFLVDKKSLRSKKDELDLYFKINKLKLNLKYVLFNSSFLNNNLYHKRQIVINSNYEISNKILIKTNIRKNLDKLDSRIVSMGASLKYKGDCIDVVYNINKDYTKNTVLNKKSGIVWTVNFLFKNLSN